MEYIQALKSEGRDDEIPRYVIVSDFAKIALHDLEEGTVAKFGLAELHKNVDKFAFIPCYKQHKLTALRSTEHAQHPQYRMIGS